MTKQYLGTLCHCLITLALCLIGYWWIAPSFYIGREIAQAEYRYIQSHGGKRYDCPWYCGLLPSAWTVKSVLDWGLPVLIAVAYVFVQANLV